MMTSQRRHKGQVLKIHLLPNDRQILSRFIGLIRQKYGVNSDGLKDLVLTSALHLMDKTCGDNVVLDLINDRTLLVPASAQKGGQ